MHRYHLGSMGNPCLVVTKRTQTPYLCILTMSCMYQYLLFFIQLAWLSRQKWLKMVVNMIYIGYFGSRDLPSMHPAWVPMQFLFTYWSTKLFWWPTEHSDHMVFVYISLFIWASYFQPIRSHQLSTQLMVLMEAFCIPRRHSSVDSKLLNKQQQSMVSSFSVLQWCQLHSQLINSQLIN